MEGQKLRSVCAESAVTWPAALLVLLILLQAGNEASLAGVIEATPRLVEGVLSAIPLLSNVGKYGK